MVRNGKKYGGIYSILKALGGCNKGLKLIMHTFGVSLFEFIAHTKLCTQFKTIRTIPTNHSLLMNSTLVRPYTYTQLNTHSNTRRLQKKKI